MLYLIGLGLDVGDLPYRALNVIKKCKRVLLEYYTSITNLESYLNFLSQNGINIELASRQEIEEKADNLLEEAKHEDIAILVIGDPLAATTHYYFISEGKKQAIGVEVIHASSIFTAIAKTGLMLYKFGRVVSMPFKDKVEYPITVYEFIGKNRSIGLHTLILLDLDPDKGKIMQPQEAIQYLLELEQKERKGIISQNDIIIVCSRIGMKDEKIIYTRIGKFIENAIPIGKPPFCLVLPGELSPIEIEFIKEYLD